MLNSLGQTYKRVFESQIEDLPRTRANVVGLLHRAVDLKEGRTTVGRIAEEVRAQRADPSEEWNSEFEKRQRKQAYMRDMSPTFIGGVAVR